MVCLQSLYLQMCKARSVEVVVFIVVMRVAEQSPKEAVDHARRHLFLPLMCI